MTRWWDDLWKDLHQVGKMKKMSYDQLADIGAYATNTFVTTKQFVTSVQLYFSSYSKDLVIHVWFLNNYTLMMHNFGHKVDVPNVIRRIKADLNQFIRDMYESE